MMAERKRETMTKPVEGRKTPLKRFVPLLLLFAACLAAEILIFNQSFVKSLFNRPADLTPRMSMEGSIRPEGEGFVTDEGSFTLRLPEMDDQVRNVFLDIGLPEGVVASYTLSLADEGDSYAYSLPERHIVPGLDTTYYTNVYPYGRVHELSAEFHLPEGTAFTLGGVQVNARRPLHLRFFRLFAVYAACLLIYGLRKASPLHSLMFRPDSRRQLTAVLGVIVLLLAGAWAMCHVHPICIKAPWPHQRQYQELAEALCDGQVSLKAEPSPELLQVENPYDTIYLQANHIDYQMDYAYYEGRYYVYFGIVPELLLYLPCYALTGRHFPNYLAVFVFYSAFVVMVFALYRELVRRYFPRTPFIVYLLLGLVTVGSGNYIYLVSRPDMYDVPIMAANMFTAAGLFFWLRALDRREKEALRPARIGRGANLFLGSLCMALVAGCRPQMLLFSALALPLFWGEVFRKRKLFARGAVRDTVLFCLPYAAVAAGLMAYNALRFGNPLDFGAAYSLTSNDMTHRGFNLSRIALGMYHFFVQPPAVSPVFPFLQGNPVDNAYMGRMISEFTYGGVIACNALAFLLFFAGHWREELKRRGLWAFLLTSVTAALVIGAVDANGAGILQRYMEDMVWGILLPSSILFFLLACRTQGTRRYSLLMGILTAVCLLQAAYAFAVIFGNGDTGINVRTGNPALYYAVEDLFHF